jgi:hypothetical protein
MDFDGWRAYLAGLRDVPREPATLLCEDPDGRLESAEVEDNRGPVAEREGRRMRGYPWQIRRSDFEDKKWSPTRVRSQGNLCKTIRQKTGIRTPIGRSRILNRANQINKIKDLPRQIREKSGRIRNARATKVMGYSPRRKEKILGEHPKPATNDHLKSGHR